jgi:hypothetical protein
MAKKYKLVAAQGDVFLVKEIFSNRKDAEALKKALENDRDVRVRGWKFWVHEEG